MRITPVVIVCLLFTLVGCQTDKYRGDENSPYYPPPVDTRITLHKEIPFAPDQVSVYIQDGRIQRVSELRHYYPFCKFELFHRIDTAHTISPDEITVTHVSQYRDDGPFSGGTAGQLYAQLTLPMYAQVKEDGGSPLYSYLTQMKLHSNTQPEIFRLTCARWSYPGMDEHLTIKEIRQALDSLFTLHLPNEN